MPYFTTKQEGRGTGLGLPVVRQLAEGWGGSLTVHSQLGVGTTMSVTVPRAHYSEPACEGDAPVAMPEGISAA